MCELASDHSSAIDKPSGFQYDYIILDILLPDGNGLNILKHIKAAKITSRVLIISAKNSLEDKINGLELGLLNNVIRHN